MADNTPMNGFYDIIKNVKGGLVLHLPAFDMSTNPRRVEIAHNVDKVRVPRTHALGIFTDGTLERMYKDGMFSIEPAKQFEKEVAEIFAPVEDKTPIVKAETIKEYLLKGNRAKVREIVMSSETGRTNVLLIARENIGDLTQSMISDLEKLLQVELTVENE